MPDRSPYLDALHLLARRELSVTQLRERLRDRDHDRDAIDGAIEHLLETGALDDRRVAATYIRTALTVKGRGRLRIQRELQALGIPQDIATSAIADAFGSVDERGLITKALQKKLRGGKKITSPADYARVYQFLMRQGFSPGAATAALRPYRKALPDDPS